MEAILELKTQKPTVMFIWLIRRHQELRNLQQILLTIMMISVSQN